MGNEKSRDVDCARPLETRSLDTGMVEYSRKFEDSVKCSQVVSARVPALGETVLVDMGTAGYNGSRIHPAIVTRVWGNGSDGYPPLINLKAIVDADVTPWMTSIQHISRVGPPITFLQPRPTYYFFRHEKPIV